MNGPRAIRRRRMLPALSGWLGASIVAAFLLAGCGASTPSTPPQTAPPTVASPASPAATGVPASAPPAASVAPVAPVVTALPAARIASRAPTPALDAVAFGDPLHGWAGGDGLLLATRDGGATWRVSWRGSGTVTEIATLGPSVAWAVLASGDPRNGLVRTALLRTADGGAHWTRVALDRSVGDVVVRSAVEAWAVGPQPGGLHDYTGVGPLLHTTDGGRTWSQASPGTVGGVCFADASHGWAAGRSLERTDDDGVTWTAVGAGLPNARNLGGAVPGDLACAGSALWLFQDLGGGAGGHLDYAAFRSTDGGLHWRQVLGNPFYPSTPRGIAGASAEPGPFVAAGERDAVELGQDPAANLDAVTVTHDGGASWATVTLEGVGLGAASVAMPDPAHLWVTGWTGGLGGFLLNSADGGRTWRQAWPASQAPIAAIAFVTPTQGYGLAVPGDARAVLRTDDGGSTWTRVGELPAPVETFRDDPFLLSFVDPEHGWATGAAGHLYATADGGRTWRQVPDPPGTSTAKGERPAFDVAFVDRLHGCVTSQDATGTLSSLATADAGMTWRAVSWTQPLECAAGAQGERLTAALGTLPNPFRPQLLAVAGATSAWALMDRAFAVTRDGGMSWSTIPWPVAPGNDPLAFAGADALSFVDPSHGWMLAGDGRLYVTRDGGASWTQLT